MELEQIIPWGRSFREYQQMFNLTQGDLSRSILGCGDGPASFNDEMNQLGHHVTSIDPLYQFSSGQIRQRIQDCYSLVLGQVQANRDRFVWHHFKTVEALGRHRLATMEQFLQDYDRGKQEGRYRFQRLPQLNFPDQTFELALCSHLLFLYSQHLSPQFHLDSIIELLRVAQEVRIFPLVDLAGNRSCHLTPIIKQLQRKNYPVALETVAYEFQRGGNQMLVVRLPSSD